MKGFNQFAPILTKQITAIRLFTCAFTGSCNPSTYLTHGSRVCSASLISLCSSIGFTRSQVVAACLQSLRSLAVIGGLWRLFAVRLSMMCMRSGVYGLSFVYSVGWRVDVYCKPEHSPSAEVSSTAANRINRCTGLSIILLLPSSTVR